MCSFQLKEVKLWETRAATRPLGPAAYDHEKGASGHLWLLLMKTWLHKDLA